MAFYDPYTEDFDPMRHTPRRRGWLRWIAILAIVLALLGGGALWFQMYNRERQLLGTWQLVDSQAFIVGDQLADLMPQTLTFQANQQVTLSGIWGDYATPYSFPQAQQLVLNIPGIEEISVFSYSIRGTELTLTGGSILTMRFRRVV